MKQLYAFIFFLCLAHSPVFAALFSDDMGSTASGTPPTPFISGVTFPAGLSNNGWVGGNMFFAGNPGASYAYQATSSGLSGVTLSLTVTVASGYTLDLSTVNFDARKSSTGPTGVVLIVNGTPMSVSGTIGTTFSTLTATGGPSGLTGTVTFDLVFTGSSTSSSNWTIRIDNFAPSGTLNAPLPITLLYFRGAAQNQQTGLSWATATEHHNARFIIEHSLDGSSFEEIGYVPGAGNSVMQQNYAFIDSRPAPGVNFYRLRQVDFDGIYTWSPTLSIVAGTHQDLLLSPVPVSDRLRVTLTRSLKNDGLWQVFDFSGRLVTSGKVDPETTEFNIDAASLTPGAYVVRIVDGQEMITKTFQK